MKLYIFGTCAGTEPMENRKHTSFAIEINGRFYWFDAGEGCSYTAHLMGVDLLKVSEIFISHTHMDHVGGLGNLLWNIRKLSNVKQVFPEFGDISVFIPNRDTFDGIMTVLKNTEGNFNTGYNHIVKEVKDGIVFENDNIKVFAKHNTHLAVEETMWRSFSYKIKSGDKTVVFSGDVKDFSELFELLEDGCDLLLMETGHHSFEAVLKTIEEKKFQVKKVCFLHHGREILYNYDECCERCKKINPSAILLNDGDILEV